VFYLHGRMNLAKLYQFDIHFIGHCSIIANILTYIIDDQFLKKINHSIYVLIFHIYSIAYFTLLQCMSIFASI
jgi:hypothetical protein